MFFFFNRKKINLNGVRTNDLPNIGLTPYPLELREHLSINLLFICAITRAFPSEPPNVNSDSVTPPSVFIDRCLSLCLSEIFGHRG